MPIATAAQAQISPAIAMATFRRHSRSTRSSTLKPAKHPDVTILSSGVAIAVDALKAQPGKDIWLFGGGVLFRSLLDAGLVDTVEVGLQPVLLGSGIPLIPEGRHRSLKLTQSKAMPSGILMLTYSVLPPG